MGWGVARDRRTRVRDLAGRVSRFGRGTHEHQSAYTSTSVGPFATSASNVTSVSSMTLPGAIAPAGATAHASASASASAVRPRGGIGVCAPRARASWFSSTDELVWFSAAIPSDEPNDDRAVIGRRRGGC